MKQLLMALAACTALTAAASAADLPRRMAPPPVFTPVPVFTWTGFYLGFNAGYAFDVRARNDDFLFGSARDANGFSGGAQIGYNYQFTPGSGIVVGVEADAQYVDFNRRLGGDRFYDTTVYGYGRDNLDYFGTVRGRLGYAFDRVLFYGTGGFAYGQGSTKLPGYFNTVNYRADDDFRTGYAAGGGVEYALAGDSFLNFFRASAVTLKAEFLYVNLDRSRDYYFDTAATSVRDRRNSDEFAVVRGGVNYKFGTY